MYINFPQREIKGNSRLSRNSMANDMEITTKNKKIIWIISAFNRFVSLIVGLSKFDFSIIEKKGFLMFLPVKILVIKLIKARGREDF